MLTGQITEISLRVSQLLSGRTSPFLPLVQSPGFFLNTTAFCEVCCPRSGRLLCIVQEASANVFSGTSLSTHARPVCIETWGQRFYLVGLQSSSSTPRPSKRPEILYSPHFWYLQKPGNRHAIGPLQRPSADFLVIKKISFCSTIINNS